MPQQPQPHRVDGVSRRQFLKISAGAMALTTIGGIAGWNLQTARGAADVTTRNNTKRLVIINMRGGNDGLNTVVPHSRTNYIDSRPVLRLGAPPATIDIGDADLALHPSLTNIASMFGDNDVAVINKVGYPSANLSHFSSEDIWSFGVRGSFNGLGVTPFSGWISRYADVETAIAPGDPPGVISVGQSNIKDFQGAQVVPPLQMQSISRFRFDGERVGAYSNNHNYRLQVIADTLDNHVTTGKLEDDVVTAMQQAHQLATKMADARTDYNTYNPPPPGTPTIPYPNSTLGNRLRDIATLIYEGFPTRILYTGFGGFDTHSAQLGGHANLMSDLDASIGAFSDDLKNMDAQVWANTVIVVISEFGRRVYENGSQGTDHGHGNCVFLIGGPVNGAMYDTITEGDLSYAPGYLDYAYDYRTIYSQVVGTHLGASANLGTIFPEAPIVGASPGTLV